MKPRCRGDIIKGTKSGPHLRVCIGSARDVVEKERRFNFEEEDGPLVHFNDIGNNEVDSRHTDSLGKDVLWLDGKNIICEADFVEDLVEHAVVLVFDGGVVGCERIGRVCVEAACWSLNKDGY